MKKQAREAERSPMARLTGAVYLAYFATTIVTTIIQSRVPESIGKTGSLLAFVLYAITSLLFYDLFKPVNRWLSLVAALVSLAGCVVGSLDIFHLPTYHVNALVFFGPYCVLLGYLILRSTFLPRILGALMVLAGIGWLAFLAPAVAKHIGTVIEILGVAAEGLLMLWLLAMGVNVQKWQKQARETVARPIGARKNGS
ncbi:MAG: DUF4386 domain-containing protein [Terracidiphilus sp.]|jgi:hypothetical protein